MAQRYILCLKFSPFPSAISNLPPSWCFISSSLKMAELYWHSLLLPENIFYPFYYIVSSLKIMCESCFCFLVVGAQNDFLNKWMNREMKMILATQRVKMKLIPVQMGQIFVLTIQIGLCVAKAKSAALISFLLWPKWSF